MSGNNKGENETIEEENIDFEDYGENSYFEMLQSKYRNAVDTEFFPPHTLSEFINNENFFTELFESGLPKKYKDREWLSSYRNDEFLEILSYPFYLISPFTAGEMFAVSSHFYCTDECSMYLRGNKF